MHCSGGPEADQHWERKQSSSGAGTSFAAMNSGTKEGLLRVKEFRKGYEAALRRKAQVPRTMQFDIQHAGPASRAIQSYLLTIEY